MSLGQNPTNNELSKAIQRLGHWTTPVFSAGDFTASGSMTWTVEAGDVLDYQYMVIGKTMWLSFALYGTTVGGTLSDELRITVPAVRTIASAYATNTPSYFVDNNVVSDGIILAIAGNSYVTIKRLDAANFTASTNLTHVYGQIFFEIQ